MPHTTDNERPRRFPALTRDTMTARQRELAEKFLGFSLNGMQGPFIMMLRSPEAADRFQSLGGYLRFETGIDDCLIELAVLVHARLWNDQYEWMLHAPRAHKAGLAEATIEALRLGTTPRDLSPEEHALFCYVLELERDHKARETTFRAALEHFGERKVTDLTFLLGQYATISMLLAVSEEGRDIHELPACERPFADYVSDPA